jgi:hypothetical protein
MNCLFQLGQFPRTQGGFTQEPPFNIVLKRQFVRTRFPSIARDMFPETMFGLFGPHAIADDTSSGGEEGEVHALVHVLGGIVGVAHGGGFEVFDGGIVFGLVGVGFAKGEGVVTVGFGGVVEGTFLGMERMRYDLGHKSEEMIVQCAD